MLKDHALLAFFKALVSVDFNTDEKKETFKRLPQRNRGDES